MRFFTSDTHFGHANIIKFCDRPFADVSHMNEVLIRNWNSVVTPEDEVFHLGDVALGPWDKWDGILTRLNGRKNLVIGNHDRVFEQNSLTHQTRFRPLYAGWFSGTVTNRYSLNLSDGTEVALSHFPYDGDSHDADRFDGARLVDRGTTLLHGHTHRNERVSRSAAGTLQIHVGVDAWDYCPVTEAQVVELVRRNQ